MLGRRSSSPLGTVMVVVIGTMIAAILGLLFYQSLLPGAFYAADKTIGLSAYSYVFRDPAFWKAMGTALFIALTMVVVAVPMGILFAFLLNKTDLPFKRFFETTLVAPIFVSPMVLALGFVVALGPVGFITLPVKNLLGLTNAPWTIYSLPAVALITALTHVPYVYLYVSTTIRNLDTSVEEAARMSGAGSWAIARRVTIPLLRPAVVYSAALMFLLGFEQFGVPLILGGPANVAVPTTYLYRLATVTGSQAYQYMAVVATVLVAIAVPLVFLQRYLLKDSSRYTTVGSKGLRTKEMNLKRLRWPATILLLLYVGLVVLVPMLGIMLRSVVSAWGEGVNLLQSFTLDHYQEALAMPEAVRGIINTVLIASLGGAFAILMYFLVALVIVKFRGPQGRALDYLAQLPRAVPGLILGLVFLWLFLFVPFLRPLKGTVLGLVLAYAIVSMPYGVRLLSATLMQLSPDLESAARVSGATYNMTLRKVTLPLLRGGLFTAWVLIFMQFVREYSTGVYLLSNGTEVLGSLIASQWDNGALDLIAVLATIQIVIVTIVFLIARRFGMRPGEH